jgi:hypothetical protein
MVGVKEAQLGVQMMGWMAEGLVVVKLPGPQSLRCCHLKCWLQVQEGLSKLEPLSCCVRRLRGLGPFPRHRSERMSLPAAIQASS